MIKKTKQKKKELELPDDVITENKTNEINKNLIKTGEIKKATFFCLSSNWCLISFSWVMANRHAGSDLIVMLHYVTLSLAR